VQVLITAVQTCAITGDLSMDTGPAMEGFTGAFGTFNLKVSAPSFADDSKDDFASGEGTSLLSMIIPTSGGGVLSRRRLLGKSGGSKGKREEEEKDDSVVGKSALSSRDVDEAYLRDLLARRTVRHLLFGAHDGADASVISDFWLSAAEVALRLLLSVLLLLLSRTCRRL